VELGVSVMKCITVLHWMLTCSSHVIGGPFGLQDASCTGDSCHFLSGMARNGEYGKFSAGQQMAYARMHPHIEEVVRQKVAIPHLAIADFGVSDCVAFTQVAKVVLAARQGLPVTFVLVDLPTQDWAACDRQVSTLGMGGLQPFEDCTESTSSRGMSWRRNASFCKLPGNFYKQLLPNDSIDLAVSGNAFAWLSSIHELPSPAGFYAGDDPAVAERWLEKARKDWETILSKRSVELKSAGNLVVTTHALGNRASHPYYSTKEYFIILDRILKRFLMRHEVTDEAVRNLTIGVWYHREKDLLAGFDSKQVSLMPKSVEVVTLPNALWSPMLSTDSARRARFAHEYTENCLAWSTQLLSPLLGVDGMARLRAELVLEFEAIAEHLEQDHVMGEVIAVNA